MSENLYESIKESKEEYFQNRVANIFLVIGKAAIDKFKLSFVQNEENKNNFESFMKSEDYIEHLFILSSGGDSCNILIDPPPCEKFRKKGLVAFNVGSCALTVENIITNLVFFELTKNILEHVYLTFNETYAPILHNPLNQTGWTELVTKDLMEKFNNYIAQVFVMLGLVKGRTMLPLPSHKLTSSDTTPDKDKAHVFESSIITWTKQIKNVLKLEPEMVLKQEVHPGPQMELEFWENKAENLNSIHEQLQSVEVKNILRFLEGNKSTYTNPFSKLQKDVHAARTEANDNARFLKTLRTHFTELCEGTREFPKLYEIFLPIMHTILLIWQKSKFYNSPPRLVVLIREICNQIITRAREFVSGPLIFQLISGEETLEACEKLQVTIDVCTKFKDAYFEYKAKADGQWKLTTNALFVRLDSFLERCHDILHLTNTLVQFNKLSKIDIGGTKGKNLTETVNTIYDEFCRAVEQFQSVTYDIMDIEIKGFDEDFYEFRTKIKELERRLASVITQAFDDSDTIHGRFKILESFEGLLTRPIIQDELEKKHILLLETYKVDLKTVQAIFLEGRVKVDGNHDLTPVFNNMPPITGALSWCRGLQERIKEPLDKLSALGQVIIEREEYKDVQKLFSSLTKQTQDYEQAKILQWQKEVAANSQEKLNKFLIFKEEEGTLKVNFDPSLSRLLKEVKYFNLLKIDVPEEAGKIYEKNDIYRQQIVSLDLIVQNYNKIITCLHSVEEPLIKQRIVDMDDALRAGLDTLQWKSNNIQQYIEQAKFIVDQTYEVVQKMKGSVQKIEQSLQNINKTILDRKNRPLAPDDFEQNHRAMFQNRQQLIRQESTVIHKLLKEVHDAVKVDKKLPCWQAYTDYINDIVLQGLVNAIMTACSHLNDQINPEFIKKHELMPLFEIRLELGDKDIEFDPMISEHQTLITVRNTVKNWVNDFFQLSQFVVRLDKPDPSDFLQEIRDNFELKIVLTEIFNNLDYIQEKTDEVKNKYRIYEEFWTKDADTMFEVFLKENEVDDLKVKSEEEGNEEEQEINKEKKVNPLLVGCREKIPPLSMFDESILSLKAKFIEIQKLERSKDIAWLRINFEPVRRSLSTIVEQWQKVYTNFLKNQVKTTLKNLQNFIKFTNDGIKKNPSDDENVKDKHLLMKVMKIISDVKEVEPSCDPIIKRIKEMVLQLKKHNVMLQETKGEEDPLQQIENAQALFKETTQKVFECKAQIIPLIAKEAVNLKNELNKFKNKVDEFRKEFLEKLPFRYQAYDGWDKIDHAYKLIDEYKRHLVKKEEEAEKFNKLERLFELEIRKYKELRDCNTDLKNLKVMWDAISVINYQYQDWKGKQWRQIKADLFIEQNKVLAQQAKQLPKEVKNFQGFLVLTEKVKNMGVLLPLVQSLFSEFMEKRHWEELKKITGKEVRISDVAFTFENIIDMELYKYEAQVNELVDVAQKEAKIEKKLKTIDQAWTGQIFEFEDIGENKVFLPLDNVLELLDQNSLDLMGMKSQGKYVEFFKDTVEYWREKLGQVNNVIDEWLKVQKNWKVLVNIFMKSEDIKSQLPEDTKVFEGVDSEFKEMMNDVSFSPLIVEQCTQERLDTLQDMSARIKRCEKSLNDYLEQKKKAFPRFYFLSNQSLLTILSNGTNPPKVCEFLGDCFEGLKGLTFQPVPENSPDYARKGLGLISKENEKIPLKEPYICEGAVETWLLGLEFKMRECLEDILQNAKSTSELWEVSEKQSERREHWLEGYPAQIALLTTQIVWQEDVSRSFEELAGGSESAMKDCAVQIKSRIEQLIIKIRGRLDHIERGKIINIITIDVHSRDVVEKFVLAKVQEPESFAWLSQLKFYFENKDSQEMAQRQNIRFPWERSRDRCKCIVKIVDWFKFYSFEYVGNSIRLVVTPLTDRCYITLTQALNLTLGGAPAGPAGTGKTETTKDLGRGIGLAVMVFNCSDQMNKDSMAQIFMGLAQSGCWGCFDEFNRISIEVLSVVSSQVKNILDALKERKTKFFFMEEGEINLQDTVGMFITMNPGYAGRTELPDNLKALFRSCAMVVPDIVLICENMLMSEGFSEARSLSKKFVTLYDLSKELLSKQRHYDWGLRAVKSVLRQAGGLKRSDPDIPEDPLLMRALRDFNLPKIVTDDKAIFLRLIADLFPKVEAIAKTDPDFKKMVIQASKEDLGLQTNEENFVMKVIHLKEILEVRHCMFLIGPPGSGKTTVWKTLAQTNINCGEDCEYDTLNPKAVTSDELYGSYTKSKEWKNGVLSMIMKNMSKNEDKYKEHHKHKWLVLDGDVDPDWIESLNTVMDDNKILTLVSNDRIPLTPAMRLLIEVSNLKNATPATVSRGGVLFINDTDIGWIPYMNSWLERGKEAAQRQKIIKANQDPSVFDSKAPPQIDECGKSVFYRCFQSYIETNAEVHRLQHIAPVVDIQLIMAICTILDALLIQHGATIKKIEANDEAQKQAYEALFLFAGMWAIGGSLEDEKDQKNFNAMWRAASKVKFPEQGLAFDYFFDPAQMIWVPWKDNVKPYAPDPDVQVQFNQIYVPTLHTTRLRSLLEMHVLRFKPVMFIGSAGTGKTAVMKDFLTTTSAEKVQHKTMNFNSFTDSMQLQKAIESMIEKKGGRTFGSATNKVLVFFIDDMNMPYVDKYGTQSPIALLRQIFDYNLIFNREQLEEKKYLQDLLFMGCLNPKSGSFLIDLRLQRYYSVFTMFTPSDLVIKTVYGSILQNHFQYFDKKIGDLSDKIVEGTVQLFKRILLDTRFSPTALKFHYQFNLRELSKVTEGLMLATPENFNKLGPTGMAQLWVHECTRVFEDRLINAEDIKEFQRYVNEAFTKNIPEEKPELLQQFVVYTPFINDGGYSATTSIEELKKVLEDRLQEHNDMKTQMDLVLFKEAMQHVCRIIRILSFPTGNAMLVGVGGSGKQSLSRLACFILGYDIEQIVVTGSFGMMEFRNFLQEVFKKIAKPNCLPRAFMITDSQIKDESFLIPINDMLSMGWVGDLFTKEDIDGMVSVLRNECKAQIGVNNPSPEQMWEYFLTKMRNNLKMILCFSPVGDNFRVKARKFPALVNNTSVDWFHPWPKDALISVAQRFLMDVQTDTQELREQMGLNMAEVHSSIDVANTKYLKQERRYNYTTPKSFLELISFYKKILGEKRSNIIFQIERYEQGLTILAETKSKVEGLQQDLKVKMVEVEQRRGETNILIEKVGAESAIAEEEQEIANQEEAKTNEAANAAEKLKNAAEIALAEALPAMERAKDAVNCLKKPNITEMKSMGQPPQGVVITAKAVMILLGEKLGSGDVWKKAQNVMNNPAKFMESIQNFNGDSIDDRILTDVRKVIDDPEVKPTFNEIDMLKKNYAAAKLCSWVVNILTYNRIFKEVKPLVEERDRATEEVAMKMKDLAIVKEKVRVLNEKVAALRANLFEAETEKQKVEAQAQTCLNKLEAAEKLVNGLAGENKRWTATVVVLKENTKSIIGDCLLASAFVSYIGAFSSNFRLNLWQNIWIPDIIQRQIPITPNTAPLKILTTETIHAKWKNENLPSDMMSLENAAIITSCSRWPLIIDPQLQGTIWLKTAQGENMLIINLKQDKWMYKLTNAIQMGKAVMIEGIQQEIDATLDPLLCRAAKKKGRNYILELGGGEIDYDPNFKLFLTTKLFNPHFRPEIAAQCTLINFIVTESGLEDQLLALVVKIERNELEERKQELVKRQNEYQMTLDKLEEALLQALAEADPATILDNKQLIANLDNTKKTAIEIEVQREIAKVTEVDINNEREKYRSVAAEGSMLYFLIITLNNIDHMYQYSLDSFITFFRKAIDRTQAVDDTRIDELRKNIRFTVYQWISRGLFEKHKLIFLTLITFRLMQKKIIDVVYDPAHMDFLIKCHVKPGPSPLDWLPQTSWEAVQGLSQLDDFKSFAQNIEKDAPNRFKDWYNELEPEDQKLPLDWKKLDQLPFQKLMVLRCLRPDRVSVAMTHFIRGALPNGEGFVDMDSKLTFTEVLQSSIQDSEPLTPLFFILSPGADPVKEVEKIAKIRRMEVNKNFFYLALGQGQDEIATRRITEGNKEGHWVMLQNIHLMPSWLPELEKMLEQYAAESGAGNANFRLFLSAEPSKGVPIGILDKSIKLTNEPPTGLKSNMKRAWTYFSKEEIEDKDPKVKQILFALCFFHSTVIERRRFGPMGWNMFYPFNIGDLRDSQLVLTKYMEAQAGSGKVPFEDLIYIFGEIMYGGHIVDDWDRRLAIAYLTHIMNENLFDELQLFPYIDPKSSLSFTVPAPNTYEKFIEHIDQSIKQESPLAYGLHPNTEIGFMTLQCSVLFNTLIDLQPREAAVEGKEEGMRTPNELARDYIKQIVEHESMKKFNLEDIKGRLDADARGPYQNVFLQEVEYMNVLVSAILTSCQEIELGFQGALTITESMEQIIIAISLNRVPADWIKVAYPSKRGLASWFINLVSRHQQLENFNDEPVNIAKVVQVNKLFNPQSFLTAIKQVIGQKNGEELNKLYIHTEFTKKSIEEIEQAAKDGSYVFGFILEGARWDLQIGMLEESRPKEMFCLMPVCYCKALKVQENMREDKTIYICPTYKTQDRGTTTYVFPAQLKTRLHPRKWILAGVALLLDVEGVSEVLVKK